MDSKGLVSVIENGKVVMKIIAASGGFNALKVSKLIKTNWPVDIFRAYDIAINNQFGVFESLVVMDTNSIQYLGTKRISDMFRDTFHISSFNPYWEGEDENNVVIIDVDINFN